MKNKGKVTVGSIIKVRYLNNRIFVVIGQHSIKGYYFFRDGEQPYGISEMDLVNPSEEDPWVTVICE